MAATTVDIASPSGLKKYHNTAVNGTIAGIASGSVTLHSLVIDNSANAATSYLKLWNTASGSVTVGTTAPDVIIYVPASTKFTVAFLEGMAFGTALSAACVTTAGTAGTTNPSSSVVLDAIYA